MRRLTQSVLFTIAALAAAESLGAQAPRALEAELRSAQYRERIQGDVDGAIAVYRRLAASADRAIASSALLALADAFERSGRGDAEATFVRLGAEYGDTPAGAAARRRLARQAGRAPVQRAVVTGPDANEIWSGVSPDGRYLPFSDPETGNLAIRDLNSGQTRLVTNAKEGLAEAAVWSPDGRQLAYSWWHPDPGGKSVMQLRIVARENGTPRVLFTSENWMQPFDWSRDGRSILSVVDTGAGYQLGVIAAADGAFRPVKPGVNPSLAQFSPDGRHIAYDYTPTKGAAMRDINIIAVDGTNDRPLVASPDHDFLMGWFPDGGHLLFGSDRLNAPGAWAIAVQNGAPEGEPRLVKADIGRTTPLGFDRKGRFFSTLSVAGGDVFIAEIDPASGKMTKSLQPAPKPQTLARRSQGTWSPDGRQLVYAQSVEGRGTTLVVQTIATGDLMTRAVPLANIERPSWFPDGQTVALEANDVDRVRGIYKVDLRTGDVTPLLRPVQSHSYMTPDGQFLAYVREQTHWRRRIADGTEEVIVKGRAGGSVISADGQSIARWISGRKGGAIGVMPATGGPERVVVDNVQGALSELAFSHDGRHIFYIANRDELWRVPAAGGPGMDTGIRVPLAKHISVNADGRRIALSGGVTQAEVWMWENLLTK